MKLITIVKLNKLYYSTVAAMLLFSTSVADEITKLDSMNVATSVIGTSSKSDLKNYAGNRTIITAEEMKKTGSTSVDSALQRVPGVKIQDETGTGVLPNISVRGLTASRSGHAQFLMDGIPLTLAPYGHTGQSIFPATLSTIDRIDIVRGGAAVQYGPNNVGGVINLVTKEIPQDWENEINNKTTSFDGTSLILNDLYLRSGGWVSDSFALQLESNFLTGESFREHSDTDVKNFQLKTNWLISDTQELQTFLQYYNADTQMPGALSPIDYEINRNQSKRLYDEYEGKSTRWNLKYIQDLNIFDESTFELNTFGHKSDRFFQWGFATTSGMHWADPSIDSSHIRTSPRKFNVYGIEPKIAFHLGDKSSITQNIIAGMRYVNEGIDYKLTQTSISTGIETTPRDWELNTDAYAFYLSDEIGLLNDKLKVTPGLRYEVADMKFTNHNSNEDNYNKTSELLPGFTLSYKLTDNWTTYTNAQKSLRTPQIAYIRGKGKEANELAWNYELGARYTTDETALNFAFYRIDFKDQLQWNSADQTFDNVGKTKHNGIEISTSYHPKSYENLDFGLGYNYLKATLEEGDYSGNYLPHASKHQFTWNTTYKSLGYETTLSGYYFSKSFTDNANTVEENTSGSVGQTPSYTVWNLNIGKEIYKFKKNKLRVDFTVNNLFDKDYYFRGIDVSPVGRYSAPGRSYSFNINYKF